MSPDVTISLAGHTIHISNFDLAVACALIFTLAVIEIAFSLGRSISLRRKTNRLMDQLETAVHVLERISRELTARSAPWNGGSQDNAPPVPQPAEWRKTKSRHVSPYSMFGR